MEETDEALDKIPTEIVDTFDLSKEEMADAIELTEKTGSMEVGDAIEYINSNEDINESQKRFLLFLFNTTASLPPKAQAMASTHDLRNAVHEEEELGKAVAFTKAGLLVVIEEFPKEVGIGILESVKNEVFSGTKDKMEEMVGKAEAQGVLDEIDEFIREEKFDEMYR